MQFNYNSFPNRKAASVRAGLPHSTIITQAYVRVIKRVPRLSIALGRQNLEAGSLPQRRALNHKGVIDYSISIQSTNKHPTKPSSAFSLSLAQQAHTKLSSSSIAVEHYKLQWPTPPPLKKHTFEQPGPPLGRRFILTPSSIPVAFHPRRLPSSSPSTLIAFHPYPHRYGANPNVLVSPDRVEPNCGIEYSCITTQSQRLSPPPCCVRAHVPRFFVIAFAEQEMLANPWE